MTWPSEERRYFKSTEEFVKHNIDHILENCMEKIKPQPKKQQKMLVTTNTSTVQKRKNHSSTGTTPMKIPRGAEALEKIRELKNVVNETNKEDQEVLKLCITPDKRRLVCQQSRPAQQEQDDV